MRATRSWATAAALGATLAYGMTAWAGDDDSDDDDEIPFDVASVYFELNNTDGDLGIHALIDGGPWKQLEIESPNEKEQLQIRLKSKLKKQGLTELFFESAEPTFDELAPEKFFRRFPEGDYEVSGISTEGQELESISEVTHLMPAPPQITVDGQPVSDDCDEDPGPTTGSAFTASWAPVTHSHPELGRTNEPIEVERYELVIEQEEPEEIKFTVLVPADVTEVDIPGGLMAPGEVKIEVLVRESSGNQTATESCFEIE